MQAVADPSLVALADCMAGKQSKSLSMTAKPDAIPSHGSAAAEALASNVPTPSPSGPVSIAKQKHAKSPKQSKSSNQESFSSLARKPRLLRCRMMLSLTS